MKTVREYVEDISKYNIRENKELRKFDVILNTILNNLKKNANSIDQKKVLIGEANIIGESIIRNSESGELKTSTIAEFYQKLVSLLLLINSELSVILLEKEGIKRFLRDLDDQDFTNQLREEAKDLGKKSPKEIGAYVKSRIYAHASDFDQQLLFIDSVLESEGRVEVETKRTQKDDYKSVNLLEKYLSAEKNLVRKIIKEEYGRLLKLFREPHSGKLLVRPDKSSILVKGVVITILKKLKDLLKDMKVEQEILNKLLKNNKLGMSLAAARQHLRARLGEAVQALRFPKV